MQQRINQAYPPQDIVDQPPGEVPPGIELLPPGQYRVNPEIFKNVPQQEPPPPPPNEEEDNNENWWEQNKK
jgi:hypothetical protein